MQKINHYHIAILIIIVTCLFGTACVTPGTQSELSAAEPQLNQPDMQDGADKSQQQTEPRFHVIWDDDGSPDGMTALLYFLLHPEVRVKAIVVSSGEAYPEEFTPLLERMLFKLGRTGIPVGAGSETPLVGDNAFPDTWRAVTSDFWGIELPDLPTEKETQNAAELIVAAVNSSPKPITYFISGTHTNLAEALRMDPSIKENIASVEIMGGALFVPGNIASDWVEGTNETAEWNIYVDPAAAEEVFSAGIPMKLTPLDATNQVVFDRLDSGAWRNSHAPEAKLAGALLGWMLTNWFEAGVFVWDLVAAVNLTNPEFCESEDLYIEVITEKGADEGRTIPHEGAAPNLTACLNPDIKLIKQQIKDIFGK